MRKHQNSLEEASTPEPPKPMRRATSYYLQKGCSYRDAKVTVLSQGSWHGICIALAIMAFNASPDFFGAKPSKKQGTVNCRIFWIQGRLSPSEDAEDFGRLPHEAHAAGQGVLAAFVGAQHAKMRVIKHSEV